MNPLDVPPSAWRSFFSCLFSRRKFCWSHATWRARDDRPYFRRGLCLAFAWSGRSRICQLNFTTWPSLAFIFGYESSSFFKVFHSSWQGDASEKNCDGCLNQFVFGKLFFPNEDCLSVRSCCQQNFSRIASLGLCSQLWFRPDQKLVLGFRFAGRVLCTSMYILSRGSAKASYFLRVVSGLLMA